MYQEYSQEYKDRCWCKFFRRVRLILAGKNPDPIRWTPRRRLRVIAYCKQR